jgi:hypothetical protein
MLDRSSIYSIYLYNTNVKIFNISHLISEKGCKYSSFANYSTYKLIL